MGLLGVLWERTKGIYVCIYMYLFVYVYIYVYIFVYLCICACTCKYIYLCMWIRKIYLDGFIGYFMGEDKRYIIYVMCVYIYIIQTDLMRFLCEGAKGYINIYIYIERYSYINVYRYLYHILIHTHIHIQYPTIENLVELSRTLWGTVNQEGVYDRYISTLYTIVYVCICICISINLYIYVNLYIYICICNKNNHHHHHHYDRDTKIRRLLKNANFYDFNGKCTCTVKNKFVSMYTYAYYINCMSLRMYRENLVYILTDTQTYVH
jgi:hypothetical protein